MLVNDVERFRGYTDEGLKSDENFIWKKRERSGEGKRTPEYFRFAYMQGKQAWDYTKAGIWESDGEWTEMLGGPSRVKRSAVVEEPRLVGGVDVDVDVDVEI